MKKLKLLVAKPSDDRKTIYNNLYLEQQGIKIILRNRIFPPNKKIFPMAKICLKHFKNTHSMY